MNDIHEKISDLNDNDNVHQIESSDKITCDEMADSSQSPANIVGEE